MSHFLTPLFQPAAVAVYGASERPGSVGAQVTDNLVEGGFAGELVLINPRHETLRSRPCFPSLRAARARVDLAVVATPGAALPDVLADCREAGVRAMIVLSAGFAESGPDGVRRQQRLVAEARRAGIQLLGPNCLGLMSAGSCLNATFASLPIRSGSLSLVSQSGALCTAILDWAQDMPFGFSAVVSVGNGADVSFGELLDYLATDESTKAILLYVEGVRDTRRFMSGLRVAARLKPTVVLKAGRHPDAARAAHTHTGSMVGSDDVFHAALRRAGAVRAENIGQLFSAAQLLGAGHRVRGDGLCVLSNAGGPAVMAVDRCADRGVELARLAAETRRVLSSALPAHAACENPVDVLGDAGPRRYAQALGACLADPGVHGVLVILTPQAMTDPTACAEQVVAAIGTANKPVLACWMGGRQVAPGRELLVRHGVPAFNTPEAAVDAFHHLCAHRRHQRQLLQAVEPMSYRTEHDVRGARLIIESALEQGRQHLSGAESKAVASAFGIPCSTPLAARTPSEALVAAESLGFPVAIKLDSPDLAHKTDVDGVELGIEDGARVRAAFERVVKRAAELAPQARIEGVTVERMHRGRGVREARIGVSTDESFGPAISVGVGGVLVELIADSAVGLPPLNAFLARDLVARTALSKWLGPFRGKPAVPARFVEEVLARVSDLACELPEVSELDINPLLLDESGALAVDVRIAVRRARSGARPYAHVAIHPYPAALARREQLPDGTDVSIRPIRPEDAEMEQRFVRELSGESRYFRFMHGLSELTPEMLTRFTQIDYDREMAFVALVGDGDGEREIGVSRYVTNPDGRSADFALVVADAWHGRGVGTRLMQALFDAARQRGIDSLTGEVLAQNGGMLRLVRSLGFTTEPVPGDAGVVAVAKEL